MFSEKEPELKRCPCCGSKATLVGGGHRRLSLNPYSVQCSSRLCNLSTGQFPDKEYVIELWNTRIKEITIITDKSC